MDVTLADLWLPILVSSVVVFFASFIAWMVLPHHKPDVKKLPEETSFLEVFKSMHLAPGQYMWPNCADKAEMKSEEFKQRFNTGPWGSMIVPSGKPNFMRNLVLTLLFYVVVSTFTAYIASESRVAGAEYMTVFQIAGASAVGFYILGGIPHSIFFGRPLRTFITDTIDGVVYGLLTAGIFAWLWPAAPAAIDAVTGG